MAGWAIVLVKDVAGLVSMDFDMVLQELTGSVAAFLAFLYDVRSVVGLFFGEFQQLMFVLLVLLPMESAGFPFHLFLVG